MALAFEVTALEDVVARIQGFLKMETPQGLFDKMKMLPKLAELGSSFSEEREDGRLQRSDAPRERREPAGFSDFEVLAAGRRKIHHVSAGVHEKSGDGQAECRDVPDADL